MMSRPMLLVFLLLILIITSQFEWRQPLVNDIDTKPAVNPKQLQISKWEEGVKEKEMSRVGDSPMLDLELNLSPSRPNPQVQSPKATSSSSSSEILSAESSCVSSEPADMSVNYPSNLVTAPMLVAGCPRCLMYVMLSEVDPKCPKCKSTALLDFLREENTKKTTT
uniref:GIR1-like zinc ribbon domain-containing protein n=2 Tax=Salix TaxID=40685 RepID=A0A6N2LM15_SALVM